MTMEEINQKELEEKISSLEKELNDYRDAYLRKNAEFNTFVTRKNEELEREKKIVLEKFLVKLLEIKGEFELSLQHSEDTENFKKGVEMILSKLNNLVTEEGVEEISTEGEFNPEIHDGIAVNENQGFENNHIIQTFSKGYKLNGKVIVPAKVVVNKIQKNTNDEGADNNEQ